MCPKCAIKQQQRFNNKIRLGGKGGGEISKERQSKKERIRRKKDKTGQDKSRERGGREREEDKREDGLPERTKARSGKRKS